MPLPNAPKPEDFKERVPRSLQRIMLMRDTLAKQEQQRRDRQQQHQLKQQEKAASGAVDGAAVAGDEQQQPQPAANGAPQQVQKRVADSAAVDKQQKQQKPDGSDKKQKQKQAGAQEAQQQRRPQQQPMDLWDQPKKLKQRKKEYLNKKKLKRRGQDGTALLASLHEKELVQDKVKFGERVDAPLQVQLKRKHWVKRGGDGTGAGAEDTSKERCTRIFAQQMATAQHKLQKQQRGSKGDREQQQQQQQQQPSRKKQKHAAVRGVGVGVCGLCGGWGSGVGEWGWDGGVLTFVAAEQTLIPPLSTDRREVAAVVIATLHLHMQTKPTIIRETTTNARNRSRRG